MKPQVSSVHQGKDHTERVLGLVGVGESDLIRGGGGGKREEDIPKKD